VSSFCFGRKSLIPVLVLLAFALLCGAPSRATIQYEVSLEHPERHLFHVKMTIPNVTGEVVVQMAAWNTLYQIRDFSSHVQEVEAFVGSDRARIEKVDKHTWRVNATGTLTVRYATYWDEQGPFATQLNSEHAFINPAMILFYVPERRNEDDVLSVTYASADWRAAGATYFASAEFGKARSEVFKSSSFDGLADAPIEIGKFEEFSLKGIQPEIRVVVHGDGWRKRQVEDDLWRICQYELKLMDGAPYERYTFILHLGKGWGGGGMEHANSTAIAAPSDEYLPTVAAHEFFHLWNVKRIKPASLSPVDYTKEQYTRALWFAEGVTNTYASYALVRSGIWSKQQFYADIGEQITELEGRPANRWQSAEQSSLDAWLEKYPLYNRPENSVSYYTKGQILGDLLDIMIRDRTENTKSLDDVVRALNSNFAKQGKAYRDSLDIRLTAEKITGSSFEEFFQKYVAGAEPLPYQLVLALAGLALYPEERRRPTVGFYAERDARGALIVQSVEADGSAAEAGLRAGDVIIAWNGGEIPKHLDRWLREQKSGELLRLKIRREDQEVTLEFRIREFEEAVYEVSEAPHAGEKARRIRKGMLHGTTASASSH
jgi:predicted metalloprotease with PDZ domain